jgi:hypothetical protein
VQVKAFQTLEVAPALPAAPERNELEEVTP